MDDGNSFARVIRRLMDGDQDAATAIYFRYRDRLIALARTRLDRRIRRREDPEDVVQSAYQSFFRRCTTVGYNLKSWDELGSLLAAITASQCINRVEYHLAKCRTLVGEIGEEGEGGMAGRLERAPDGEPTPLEAAIQADIVDGLYRRLKPLHRPILALTLQGYTTEEVAALTATGETTVRRQKRWIKERLLGMQTEVASKPG